MSTDPDDQYINAYEAGVNALVDGCADLITHLEQDKSLFGRPKTPSYSDSYGFGPLVVELDTESDGSDFTVDSISYRTTDAESEFSLPVVEPDVTPSQLAHVRRALDAFLDEWDDALPDTHTEARSRATDAEQTVETLLEEAAAERGDPLMPGSVAELITEIERENEEAISRALPDLTRQQQDALFSSHRDNLEIHYQDDVFALFTISLDRPLGSRQSIYVIGRDDTPTGFFIHELDLDGFIGGDMTRAEVRHAMGFEADLDHDALDELPQRTATRVQGDLKITHLLSYNSPEEAATTLQHAEAVCTELKQTFGGPAVETRVLPTVRLFYDVRAGKFRTHVYDSFPERGPNGLLGRVSEESNVDRVYLNRQIAEEIDTICTESGLVSAPEDLDTDTATDWSSLTLPVDNHLLQFDAARIYPLSTTGTEPVIVSVPESGTVSITHDEHPEKRVPLDPGLYELGLLRRGELPAGFTTP